MLRGDPLAVGSQTRSSFHYLSAPLYVLTAIVGGLLVADWLLTSSAGTGTSATIFGIPGWRNTLFGYRFALIAAVLGGSRILYHALDGLLSGRIGADLALTIACLAAIVLGEHQTAGLVVFISLVGESLEGYTIDRARWAVRQTFALQPAIAHLTHEGRERDVPIGEVRVGDFLVVRIGERIPADGKVVTGRSAVDQSAFTGESLPVDKSAGDKVFAGTLNQFGPLTIVAEQIGSNTALAKVADLVGSAASRKADLERTVDRLARWFLPAVLIAALLTLIGWRIAGGTWQRGILPALGVLVVACPCPLVLATPAAVMAALAWLARRGVVVRGSQSLERLARVDTFAFDKTGTLTQGQPRLLSLVPLSTHTDAELLVLAASLQQHSEHPLARAVHGLGVVGQVEVAVPEPELHVGHPGVLVWVGQQRFRQHHQFLGEHRQLAGLGGAETTVHADKVAQVEFLRQFPAHKVQSLFRAEKSNAITVRIEWDHETAARVVRDFFPLHEPDQRPAPSYQGGDQGLAPPKPAVEVRAES